MKLSLIVAAAKNSVIGCDNKLPWHLPQDLKYFKSVTLGKPIIMGRKTYESIGRPLPGRTNIVITRQADWFAEGVLIAKSVDEALVLAGQVRNAEGKAPEEVMVIGGAEIYRSALAQANRVYLTRIDVDVEGDAYFAELPSEQWELVSEAQGDIESSLPHRFLMYEKI